MKPGTLAQPGGLEVAGIYTQPFSHTLRSFDFTMAQRKVTTVLQMLADKKAAAEAATAQTVQAQYAQHTQSDRSTTIPQQTQTQAQSQEPVSFTQLAAAQSLPVTMQQSQQAQHYDARAINPYLDPDIEMPEPEPFDISSLGYAESAPVNPLSGAIHASGITDNVYDQVYL